MTDDRSSIDRLLEIMDRLRDPVDGCPWDREQSFATIAPYTIEEAYEVADAIDRRDMSALKDELGDLLFQVVFHARMAREAGAFDFSDVADSIADKMVRRHPHVFPADDGSGTSPIQTAADQKMSWEDIKARERSEKTSGDSSTLDGVPMALPALTRAEKLGKRAARVGFDWTEAQPVLDQIDEELTELKTEMATAAPVERLADELGDLLFTCVNLARHLGVDPETALRGTNAKFERRFRRVEALAGQDGQTVSALSLDALERLWQQAKLDADGESDDDAKGKEAP